MEDNYEVFFHGSVPFKGAQMVIGAVLVLNNEIIDEIGGVVPYTGSPSRANWEAMVQGMNLAKKNGVRRLILKGNSKDVVNHMNGKPLQKGFDAVDYYKKARNEQLNFDQCFFQWVPLEQNALAVRLVKAGEKS